MQNNGFRNGSEVFVSYQNDDGTIKSGFFILVELNDNYVVLQTQVESRLLIPMNKILKIKSKKEQND